MPWGVIGGLRRRRKALMAVWRGGWLSWVHRRTWPSLRKHGAWQGGRCEGCGVRVIKGRGSVGGDLSDIQQLSPAAMRTDRSEGREGQQGLGRLAVQGLGRALQLQQEPHPLLKARCLGFHRP